MRVSDFHFDLPDELIARYPKEDRSSCRLLQLNGENGEISHRTFTDVLDLIDEGDLLIFNNTRCGSLLVCLVVKPAAGKLKCWWNVF